MLLNPEYYSTSFWDLFCNILEIFCSPPQPGTNTVEVPGTNLKYQEIYTYSCKDGYNTSDEISTVCQSDGSLSVNNPPSCSGEWLSVRK